MIFGIVFAVIALISVIVLIGGYISYRLAFRASDERLLDPYLDIDHDPEYEDVRRELISFLVSRPCEEIRIKSRDGLTLFARYYHVKDGAPLEIQVHGYRSISRRDFSASGRESISEEYNLLLIDQRAHGESDGQVISFGIKERFDVIDWVKYAENRFGKDTKIILLGISMGAATVLMAAGEDLPDSVKGVIADCPYSSPIDIICRVGKRMHIPAFVTRIIAPIGARVYGGFSLYESSPVSAVSRAKVPILLIHGEADNFVPLYMSREIAAKNPEIRLLTFPLARHGFSFLVDTDRYRIAVREFIAEAIS